MTQGTTHADWGAGRPRLVEVGTEGRVMFPLTKDVTHIGSDRNSDIVVEGVEPEHARIEHSDDDEYVLTMLGPGNMSAMSLREDARVEILRTGAQFTIGEWTLVFMRDEYADHGRPFGGREGGEGSGQKEQPPRPDYRKQHEEALAAGKGGGGVRRRGAVGISHDDTAGTPGEEYVAEHEDR